MISYVYLGILKYVISSCPAEIEGFSPFFCDGVGARAVVTRHLMWEGSMLLRSGDLGWATGGRRDQTRGDGCSGGRVPGSFRVRLTFFSFKEYRHALGSFFTN